MKEKIRIDYNSRKTEGFVDELFHPIHQMYQVRFDDGYENIFFTDVDSGRWIEQDIGFTSLAEEVGEKIKSTHESAGKISRTLQWYRSADKKETLPVSFAFYHYSLGTFPVFEIYAPNRRFLFSMILVNKDFWQVFRIEDDWSFDESGKLIKRLPGILEEFINNDNYFD